MKQSLLRAAILALITPLALAAPPVADVRDVPATLHGQTVHDPYRWLENVKSAPAKAWFEGQGEAARSVLDRIDGRDAIIKRLDELARAQGDAVRAVMQMPGDRLYYLKRARGERQFKLYVREGLAGAEKLLVDPEIESRRTGVPHAINHYRPSWDGQHVAYADSAGGSENASLHILQVASGKELAAPIPRVQEAAVNWLPDSQALTFNQLVPLKAGAPVTDFFKDSRVMLLRLDGKPAQPVFGPTVTRKLGLERLDVAQLITVPGSPWVVARTTDTTVPEGKMFVAPLATLGRPGTPWKRFASEADQVLKVALRGDDLFVLTQAKAPLRKIVKVDLRQPSMARAMLVAAEPQPGAVINDFQLTPTALLAEMCQGTALVLRRYETGDTAGRTLPAPAQGTADLAAAPAADREALLYSFSSWTEPSRWYLLEGSSSREVTLGDRAMPPGLPAVEVTDVVFESHDGVKVPMTVLHKKGLVLDGNNPVLLNGYASYGSSISAYFSIESMVWIERGGVSAFVNPRGSGVYGDAWHRAGQKANKPNTWKDGIAAARWLIAKGYGSPKTMGITGGSAGGIFVGRATTEAPELFAAAIYNVGLLDALRAEESANGATNVSEFGSVKDAAGFKALLAMSTYHAIKDGQAYPGVLLVHGMNDPRVDVWQSGKTAARLQAAQAKLPDARPALLRLDMQAGHGIGSTLTQRHSMTADTQSFLLWQMGKATLKD